MWWYTGWIPVSKSCVRCGQTFSGPPSWMSHRRTCSTQCKYPERIVKTCAGCGGTFAGSVTDKRRYCSHVCRRRRVVFQCEMCGASREMRISEGKKRFCSDECRKSWFSQHFRGDRSPHWQGGEYPYYGPNWKAQRRSARRRDGHCCRHCGVSAEQLTEAISVAHIVPFRAFGLARYREANALSNLLSLCRPCHTAFDWANGTRH